MEFLEWLQSERGYSRVVAGDINSRLKRVRRVLHQDNISDKTISNLEANESFSDFSVNIKSQLRRAVRLYLEYNDNLNNK